MALSRVGVIAGGAFNGGGTVSLNLPTGCAVGDTAVLAFASKQESMNPLFPEGSGWVKRYTSPLAGSLVYSKVLDAGDIDDGGVSVAVVSSSPGVAGGAVYRGTAGMWVAGTSTTLVAPAVTGAPGEAVRLWLFGRAGTSPSVTLPGDIDERLRYGNSNAGIVLADNAVALTTAAAKTATKSGSGPFLHVAAVTVLLADNRPPSAPTWLLPEDGDTLNSAQTNRFEWRFYDPDPGDTQSKFALRWYDGTAWGAWEEHITPSSFIDMPPGSLSVGTGQQVQVRVYDSLGAVSATSASMPFSVADPVDAPTITYPTPGGTVAETDRVDWSYPTQQGWAARRLPDNDDGTPDTSFGSDYYTTGADPDTDTRSVPLSFPVNNRNEHIEVRVKKDGLWTDWVDVRVLVSYTPPPVADLEVNIGEDGASFLLTWAVPTPADDVPPATSVDLYLSTDGGATAFRVAARLLTEGQWTYRLPASGVDHCFQAVAVADNGSTSASPWITMFRLSVDDVL